MNSLIYKSDIIIYHKININTMDSLIYKSDIIIYHKIIIYTL